MEGQLNVVFVVTPSSWIQKHGHGGQGLLLTLWGTAWALSKVRIVAFSTNITRQC
jgi:hypothetical protein